MENKPHNGYVEASHKFEARIAEMLEDYLAKGNASISVRTSCCDEDRLKHRDLIVSRPDGSQISIDVKTTHKLFRGIPNSASVSLVCFEIFGQWGYPGPILGGAEVYLLMPVRQWDDFPPYLGDPSKPAILVPAAQIRDLIKRVKGVWFGEEDFMYVNGRPMIFDPTVLKKINQPLDNAYVGPWRFVRRPLESPHHDTKMFPYIEFGRATSDHAVGRVQLSKAIAIWIPKRDILRGCEGCSLIWFDYDGKSGRLLNVRKIAKNPFFEPEAFAGETKKCGGNC